MERVTTVVVAVHSIHLSNVLNRRVHVAFFLLFRFNTLRFKRFKLLASLNYTPRNPSQNWRFTLHAV